MPKHPCVNVLVPRTIHTNPALRKIFGTENKRNRRLNVLAPRTKHINPALCKSVGTQNKGNRKLKQKV